VNPTLRKLVNEKVIAGVSAVVAAFVARLHTPGVVGSAAQTVVMAVAVGFLLLLTWKELRRRTGMIVAGLACAALAFVLPTLLSLLSHKALEIDRRIPASPVLGSRLVDSCPREIHRTDFNNITRMGRPVVARDGQGTIHVLLDFEWMKREHLVVAEHVYEGSAYLQAGTRATDDHGTMIEPFVVTDFSIGPKKGFWAYLAGWYEAPFLMSEAGFITRWVGECLRDASATP